MFTGGGGTYDLRGDESGTLDVRSLLGDEAGRAIESCSGTTGITALVFAYAVIARRVSPHPDSTQPP